MIRGLYAGLPDPKPLPTLLLPHAAEGTQLCVYVTRFYVTRFSSVCHSVFFSSLEWRGESCTNLSPVRAGGLSVTERWRRRLLSNFDYLSALNTLAGRSVHDLTQYPVCGAHRAGVGNWGVDSLAITIPS